MFTSLTFFRFPLAFDFSELERLLPAGALKPVGPLEMSSRGFVSPFGVHDESEAMCHQIGDFIWLTLGGQDKLLPAAVVNDKVGTKLAEIERAEGRAPGGRERKRIRDDVVQELLPKAFVKPNRLDVIIDVRHGYLAVNTTSKKRAEEVVSHIRGVLGSFPAVPINAEVAPRSVLTGWISGESMPEGMELGSCAELKECVEGGGKVKITELELRSDEVEKHLEAGMLVTQLAMIVGDRLALTLGDDLAIRKLKMLDGALEELASDGGEGVRAEADARFALLSGEVRALFLKFQDALKLSAAE